MAILIPDVPKDCTLSERLVYEKLGRDLPDDCVVLHSLGLPGHETKLWGEADIVVLCRGGVFALEVKGGIVECQDGIWRYSGPNFKPFTKKEDPWSQARGTMVAIRNALTEADPAFRTCLFGYGVVMPATRFTTRGAEIVHEVLLDKQAFAQTIDHYIHRLNDYWRAEYGRKHGRQPKGLTPAQIRQARQVLRPNLETVLSIGGFLTGIAARLLQLTNEQIRVSRRISANARTIVRGAAGTGKSVLAVERARQLSSEGKRVLFLCFNQLLASHVRAALSRDERAASVEVRHAHGLYFDLIRRAGLPFTPPDAEADFFRRTVPLAAAEALLLLDEAGYDALVIDEAQDLLAPEHLDVVDLLLADGLQRGRWHMFLDPLQNLYDSDIQAQVEARLEPASPAFDDLEENCRNTRQVATQASIVSGIDLAMSGALDGLECETHHYDGPSEGLARLETLITELIRRDVRPSDLVILSTRRRENSLIAGLDQLAGRRIVDAADGVEPPLGTLLYSTMHGFKGLERLAVVAIDMDEIGEPQYAMLHYAGLSRAQGLLHVLSDSRTKGAYRKQAILYGQRLQRG